MKIELPQPEKHEAMQENVRRLFHHCFEIDHIEEGQKVPVGDAGYKSAELAKFTVADLSAFGSFYETVSKGAASLDKEKVQSWLETAHIEIDPDTFTKLYAFTKIFEKNYPQDPDNESKRREMYKERDAVPMSEVLGKQSQECAEIAAVAQGFLQHEGVASSYVSGEVLWTEDQEFPSVHSFLVIREKGKTFIYDPTNPLQTQDGSLPSLYEPHANFDEEMDKKKKVFVRTTNVMTHEESFFGVGDHASLNPERHIIG